MLYSKILLPFKREPNPQTTVPGTHKPQKLAKNTHTHTSPTTAKKTRHADEFSIQRSSQRKVPIKIRSRIIYHCKSSAYGPAMYRGCKARGTPSEQAEKGQPARWCERTMIESSKHRETTVKEKAKHNIQSSLFLFLTLLLLLSVLLCLGSAIQSASAPALPHG